MRPATGTILFLAQFPIDPSAGGVQRVTSVLADFFNTTGRQVIFLSLTGARNDHTDSRQYFLPVQGDCLASENRRFVEALLASRQVSTIINQAGIYDHVIRLVAAVTPASVDVFTVHHNCISCLHNNYRNIILGGRWAGVFRRLDYAWVWAILGWRSRMKYKKMFRRAIQQSSYLVLLAEKFKDELRSLIGEYPCEKVVAIPNPSAFEPGTVDDRKKENELLYVGRVEVSQKQVDKLLDIWERLVQQHETWSFHIVGEGSSLPWLMEQAAARGIARIHFHGKQEAEPFLMRARLLCLTSAFEGFGMVLIEAQAFGTVPVSFRSFSAIDDIILQDQSGLIVNQGDVESFANAVSGLMKDSARRQQMAKAGQEHARKFSANVIGATWLQYIQ